MGGGGERLQRATARVDERIECYGGGTDDHDIEGEFDGRHFELGAVDDDDIYGVAERGEEHEDDAPGAEGGVAVALVEEHDATDGEDDGEDGGEAYSFFEKYAHNHGYHDGIDEEDGACDACLHVEKARVERDG